MGRIKLGGVKLVSDKIINLRQVFHVKIVEQKEEKYENVGERKSTLCYDHDCFFFDRVNII